MIGLSSYFACPTKNISYKKSAARYMLFWRIVYTIAAPLPASSIRLYQYFIELCVGEIKVKSALLTTKSALTVQ